MVNHQKTAFAIIRPKALLAYFAENAGYFVLFVFLVSRDCCVALPRAATGLSAVCDCGIS